MQDALEHDHLLVFIDEAHIHLDTDEGFGWSVKGERFWVSSCSPGLAKVSFFGVYIYNLGQVRLFPYEVANGLSSIDVLKRIRAELPDQKMTKQVQLFEQRLNRRPLDIADRLWVKPHLDPEEEKL